MSSLRYAVIGMGAIGGFYGAKLACAGREVHFLSHSDYEYVLSHGLHIGFNTDAILNEDDEGAGVE